MPLIIDGGVPARWAERTRYNHASNSASPNPRKGQSLRFAFINNMPDAALEDTEVQFFDLLDAASGDVPVYVRLYSLVGLPRGVRGLDHLSRFYCDFNDLWNRNVDAAIITGTEPRAPDLRDEPYWKLLTEVFDWAARETTSTLLSCLAAHASVLCNDGVNRQRLTDKQFGVFESQKCCSHRLTREMAGVVRFPHSRWNAVRESDLISAGYSILTSSKDAGVDLFSKAICQSLFVHCQGHPEYSAETLFKEYRRDIKRFLRRERGTYPTLPHGYFAAQAQMELIEFQRKAILGCGEEVLSHFPESVNKLDNSWHSHAMSVYRGWIQYLCDNARATSLAGLRLDHRTQRQAIRPAY